MYMYILKGVSKDSDGRFSDTCISLIAQLHTQSGSVALDKNTFVQYCHDVTIYIYPFPLRAVDSTAAGQAESRTAGGQESPPPPLGSWDLP